MRHLLILPLAALLACGGESAPGGSQSQTAPAAGTGGSVEAQVEAAVRKHLSRRGDLDLTKMDLTIDAVDVRGDEADATVGFKVKDTPEAAMSMNYHLAKEADEWVVQAAPAGHGGAPPPPAAPGQGLPPGHPAAGGSQPAQELPPNHPPVAQ